MSIPLEAVLHILAWEQLSLRVYADAVGIKTWGWGHAQKKGEPLPAGNLSRREANDLFLRDLAWAENGVDKALPQEVREKLSPMQRGALVSFCYNTGHGPLGASMGLGKALREGRFEAVPAEMRRWIYGTNRAGVKVRLAGLAERREGEAALWASGSMG